MGGNSLRVLLTTAALLAPSVLLLSLAILAYRRDEIAGRRRGLFSAKGSRAATVVISVSTGLSVIGLVMIISNSQDFPGPPSWYQFIPAISLVLLPVAGLALGLVRPLAGGTILFLGGLVLPFAFLAASEIVIDPGLFADQDEMYAWGMVIGFYLLCYVLFVCLPMLIAGIVLLIGQYLTASADPFSGSGVPSR